jgi:DNA-binding LacI/PurR family transcriptional regulator
VGAGGSEGEIVVSIYDIAERAGVAPSTVSRALRDHGRIGKETRARIKQIANEMGFIPNSIAQSLVSQRTRTVGVITANLADPWVGVVIQGIEEAAHAAEYTLILTTTKERYDRESTVVDVLQQRRVEGIIVVPVYEGSEDFDPGPIPTVVINESLRLRSDHRWRLVAINDKNSAGLAVDHLLELGHRRIAYVGSVRRPSSTRYRQGGYEAALRAAGVPVERDLIFYPALQDDLSAGASSLTDVLESGATAAFCYNDITAIGLLSACRRRAIRVPDALSVVGFDDIETARLVTPALTTVAQPRHALGQTAMASLLRLVDGPGEEEPVYLSCKLVIRESTGRRR